MAIGSGISAQIGLKAESTYGTAVTVDRFFEFESESIDNNIGMVDAPLLGTGRFMRFDRFKHFQRGPHGTINWGPIMNKNFGIILQHALGDDTITGATASKTHTITPPALGTQGKFLTVQVGRPDISGTVQPFTYAGGKIVAFDLSCEVDGPLKLSTEMDFKSVTTGTGLASATYVATQEFFIFTEGTLTVGGTTVPAKTVSIHVDNAVATDRRFLGGNKLEPLHNGFAEITGTMSSEFENLTAYNAWAAGTTAQLVLTFTLATLIPTTAVPFSLTVTLPKIEYTGESPQVGGPGIVDQNRPFRALYDGTNAPITIAYVTSDTAA